MIDHQHQDTPGAPQLLTTRRTLIAAASIGTIVAALGRVAGGYASDKNDDSEHDDDHVKDHDDDVAPVGTVPPGSMEVRIDDDDSDAFEPGAITIDLGGSITWVNFDDKPHTATGLTFDTGTIEPGQQVTVKFDESGSFPYSCQVHPMMTGTVNVRDASGQVPAQANATAQASPEASPQASPVAGGETEVSITNFAFDPTELTVTVGTIAVWSNSDSVPHTVTASDGSFDSSTLMGGDTFSHQFTTTGTFDYVCQFHPNMQAKVIVTD